MDTGGKNQESGETAGIQKMLLRQEQFKEWILKVSQKRVCLIFYTGCVHTVRKKPRRAEKLRAAKRSFLDTEL